MRKIEKEMLESIRNRKTFSKQNTVFTKSNENPGIWTLYLHGHAIAQFDDNPGNPSVPTRINFCGWVTKITCSRLNALDGIHVRYKYGTPYLNDREIEDYGWFVPNADKE